jgi:hypothetical protein
MKIWRAADGAMLPGEGEAFLFSAAKGVFTFCWVVGHAGRGDAIVRGKGVMPFDRIALACAKWFGKKPPTADDLAAPEVLVTTFWESRTPQNVRPLIQAAVKPPPKSFKPIGKVGRAKVSLEKLSHGGWEAIARWSRDQWKYEQNAAKYLADWKAEDERIARENEEDDEPKELLDDLVGLIHKRRVDTLRGYLRELEKKLKKLETRKEKLAAIEATVEKINAWNDKASVIETPEREILIDAIDTIAHAAGMRGKDIAGPYRDW